ncbi:hypothetical protein [Bacteroides cellulosilyticus]|jgi:hypothetical protein|nr:hypothetical protein [Bacteroides cellulosilyticus]
MHSSSDLEKLWFLYKTSKIGYSPYDFRLEELLMPCGVSFMICLHYLKRV